MSDRTRFPYHLHVQAPKRTGTLLQHVARARGMSIAELTREYLTAGLARDAVRYNIHLPEEDNPDD